MFAPLSFVFMRVRFMRVGKTASRLVVPDIVRQPDREAIGEDTGDERERIVEHWRKLRFRLGHHLMSTTAPLCTWRASRLVYSKLDLQVLRRQLF